MLKFSYTAFFSYTENISKKFACGELKISLEIVKIKHEYVFQMRHRSASVSSSVRDDNIVGLTPADLGSGSGHLAQARADHGRDASNHLQHAPQSLKH